jgi:hypothetical protein
MVGLDVEGQQLPWLMSLEPVIDRLFASRVALPAPDFAQCDPQELADRRRVLAPFLKPRRGPLARNRDQANVLKLIREMFHTRDSSSSGRLELKGGFGGDLELAQAPDTVSRDRRS